MKNLIDPFWIGVTVFLSVLLAILLPISIIEKHGTAKTIVFTVLGIIFIWVTYFIRAYFFSDKKESEENKSNNH
jgi:purine-cytosine permease-like protein